MKTPYEAQVLAAAIRLVQHVHQEVGNPYPALRAELEAVRINLPVVQDSEVLFYLAHYDPDLVLGANWFGKRTVYGRWPFTDKRQHVRIEQYAPEYPPQLLLYGDRWARIRKDYFAFTGPRSSWEIAYSSLKCRQQISPWLSNTLTTFEEDTNG